MIKQPRVTVTVFPCPHEHGDDAIYDWQTESGEKAVAITITDVYQAHVTLQTKDRAVLDQLIALLEEARDRLPYGQDSELREAIENASRTQEGGVAA